MNRSTESDIDVTLRRFFIHEADEVVRQAASDADMANRIAVAELTRRERPLISAMVAAVMLVAVIGGGVILGTELGRDTVPAATPDMVASPSPTAGEATPTDSGARSLQFQLDPLPAGRYQVDQTFPLELEFELPDGWLYNGVGRDFFWLQTLGEDGSAGVGAFLVSRLYRDPCHWDRGLSPDLEPGVDAMVDALQGLPSMHITDPIDVTAYGFSGKELHLYAPPNLRDCYNGALLAPWYFGNTPRSWLRESGHLHAYVLDVDGRTLLVLSWDYPDTGEATVREAEDILASLMIRVPER